MRGVCLRRQAVLGVLEGGEHRTAAEEFAAQLHKRFDASARWGALPQAQLHTLASAVVAGDISFTAHQVCFGGDVRTPHEP